MIKLIRINLIPYRDYAREAKKKQFKNMLAGAALAAAVITVLLFFLLDRGVDTQGGRIALLTAKNHVVTERLQHLEELQQQKQLLLLQKRNLDGLRFRRFMAAKMLNDLDQLVPRGVQLTKIEAVADNQYLIYGRSINDNRVALLLKALGTTGLFEDKPVMNIIQTKAGLQEFKITARLMENFSFTEVEEKNNRR